MKDHLLSWHEKFQPLGPALKTPAKPPLNERAAELNTFRFRSFDHPSCTGGNAPSLSPQALVTTPAAQVFKVGDRVRFKKRYAHCIEVGETGVIGSHKAGVVTVMFPNDSPAYLDVGVCAEFLELLPSQPSDTQQWVEWDPLPGKACPAPSDGVVAYRVVQ